LYFIMIT